jgi:hypothetical protein
MEPVRSKRSYPDKRTNPDWTLVRQNIALEAFSCNNIASHAIRTNIPDSAQHIYRNSATWQISCNIIAS